MWCGVRSIMLYLSFRRVINFILMKGGDLLLQQGTKSKLRSTGSSMFYRAVGRQTKPAWGNRIVKDFYDLDYNIPTTSFKINQHFKNSTTRQNKRIREDIKKSKLNRKKITIEDNPNQSEILSDRNKSIVIKPHKRPFMHNPETIQVGELSGSSRKYLGLCPFQFSKTIQGKMEKRLSHHISFDKNKCSRIINQYPIFYNRHEDIDYSHAQLMQQRRTMATFHPFSSYSQRRVFEPKEQLDKMFDTDRARKAVSPQRLKDAVRRFEKVLQRRQASLNESARLTYETLPMALALKKKAVSYSIQRSQRQTYFSPQVISPKRGCFR